MTTFQTGHVGLNVTDLDRSIAFYRKVFDFETLGESREGDRRFAFLGLDGKLVLTLWQQSTGEFATELPGLHHLSFQVPDIDAVRRAETVLREIGAPLAYDGVVAHGEGASSGGVFFTDPDGIRLEIYAPAGAENAPAPTQAAPTCGFF
ncbi:VOC family protein [Micromonospora polyrhachis]|uniref:Catechol 2,3-dioxygenase-like lactoylglutathione lyase family enzyme n=1 Tax=Micromonospora polyrhachis TaxID=1282883 RepID=A0A7W7SUD9_9ACTN|nr:VOC family protein [Micromonospora polyrhachis]MBB4960477.1 catechol 2,3-dioxygenase-like lactoylglutathione lyase family enzyme [Micromonospora polyrhachis]